MMATNYFTLLKELKRLSRFQQTPIQYVDSDYEAILNKGIRTLYVDLGQSDDFNLEVLDDDGVYEITVDLSIAKQEYILNAAMIDFYQVVQQDVNTIVGYSTDSLTVTNADKPYANISNEINKLHVRQNELLPKIIAEEANLE